LQIRLAPGWAFRSPPEDHREADQLEAEANDHEWQPTAEFARRNKTDQEASATNEDTDDRKDAVPYGNRPLK
jgi:hypothetical protein